MYFHKNVFDEYRVKSIWEKDNGHPKRLQKNGENFG